MEVLEALTKPTIMYFGITIDCELTFWPQIQCPPEEAPMMTSILARQVTNIGKPSVTKRGLLWLAKKKR